MHDLRRIAMAALAIMNVALLGLVVATILLFVDRGFDITDEAFYLLNARHPHDNIGAVSTFGHYLAFFGAEPTRLRLVGLVGLLATGGLLAYHVAHLAESAAQTPMRWPESVALASAVLLGSLAYYRFWLITPSYNLFAYFGALFVAVGGMLALRPCRPAETDGPPEASSWIATGIFIGVGGIFAMIGRPTAALATGVLISAWCVVLVPRRYWLRAGALAVCVCLLFMMAHLAFIQRGGLEFLRNVIFAADLAASLDAGHTLQGSFGRLYKALHAIPVAFMREPLQHGLAIILFAALLLVLIDRLGSASAPTLLWPLALLCSLIVFAKSFYAFYFERSLQSPDAWPGAFGLQLNLLLGAGVLMRALLSRWIPWLAFSKGGNGTATIVAVMLLLNALALAVAFGSNQDSIEASGSAFGLYAGSAVLSAYLLFPRDARIARLLLILFVSAPVAFLLYCAMQSPYRLPTAISGQTNKMTLADDATVLRVDPATARWVGDLLDVAHRAGWRAGMPLIDLTGATPGAAFVLSARTPTTPWLVGGYRGSFTYVQKALLKADPALLRQAWILTAPEGVRRVDTSVLASVGLTFPDAYSLAGSVRTGYRDEQQFLWKPPTQSQ